MAHMQKYKATALGHMLKHYERAKDEKGNYIKFGNQDIDISKTDLNYDLCDKQGSLFDRYEDVKKTVHMHNRKDINVMVDWVITLPAGVSSDEQDKFFKESYKFMSDRYGKDNVIGANVHLDETTPHMHFSFVPVTFDEKRKRYKVSAKEVVNRKDLQTFHQDLNEHMTKAFNRDIGILNGATIGLDKVEDIKAMTKAKKALQSDIKALKGTKGELEEMIEKYKGADSVKVAKLENLVKAINKAMLENLSNDVVSKIISQAKQMLMPEKERTINRSQELER